MNKNRSERTVGSPVVIAAAVAIFGVLAMLIVDHGPWSHPKVQTAEVANYKTTGPVPRRGPRERRLRQPRPSRNSNPMRPGRSLLSRPIP
jgi:hypothetical protein